MVHEEKISREANWQDQCTTPRFRQAVQILQDVGGLKKQDDCLRSTLLGVKIKEIFNA